MPLLGNAAVAMWWTIAPEGLAEFREWHSKEHFPERMGIPGFLRGSRWEAEGGAHFVMYELEDYAVLTSDGYRASLNNPTAWSRKMMPLHSGMVRSQCRIASSQGGGVATFTATVTLSPRAGAAEALGIALDRVLAGLPSREGITAAHRLITDTPQAAATTEQQIRGADRAADWIVLVCGHQRDALLQALSDELSATALERHGGTNVKQSGPYRLVHAVTPADFRLA